MELDAGPYPVLTFAPHCPYFHFNIISPLRLGLPSGLFLLGFSSKILYAFLMSMCAACPAHLRELTEFLSVYHAKLR
jgi:hypothetical protein